MKRNDNPGVVNARIPFPCPGACIGPGSWRGCAKEFCSCGTCGPMTWKELEIDYQEMLLAKSQRAGGPGFDDQRTMRYILALQSSRILLSELAAWCREILISEPRVHQQGCPHRRYRHRLDDHNWPPRRPCICIVNRLLNVEDKW